MFLLVSAAEMSRESVNFRSVNASMEYLEIAYGQIFSYRVILPESFEAFRVSQKADCLLSNNGRKEPDGMFRFVLLVFTFALGKILKVVLTCAVNNMCKYRNFVSLLKIPEVHGKILLLSHNTLLADQQK